MKTSLLAGRGFLVEIFDEDSVLSASQSSATLGSWVLPLPCLLWGVCTPVNSMVPAVGCMHTCVLNGACCGCIHTCVLNGACCGVYAHL